MSKHKPIRITKKRLKLPDNTRTLGSVPRFIPASPRERTDGWTPDKQVAFIEALAECACVTEACERVGQSPSTAYRLRRRVDAYSFRAAWEAALDYGVRRLSDAAFSRALNGVTRPVFFQGEQVGERRYYDERLTMFLLRYRDPDTYGKWRDRREPRRRPDANAFALDRWMNHVAEDAWDRDTGAIIDREIEPDPTEWLTDEEAALAEEVANRPVRPTAEETDAYILAGISVIQRQKSQGVDVTKLKDGEFRRQVDDELARIEAGGDPFTPPDAEPLDEDADADVEGAEEELGEDSADAEEGNKGGT